MAPAKEALTTARRILVLSQYPNPTFSYYLEERLKAVGGIPVEIRGLDESLDGLDENGLFVIVCRYIKSQQLQWLECKRSSLAGIAYFIDDNIAAVLAGGEARWSYRRRLFRLGIRPLRRLNPLLSHVWASTAPLAAALSRHGGGGIGLLPPMPPAGETGPTRSDRGGPAVKMAFHATGIHRREHDFLMPIVASAMMRHPHLAFEVFADDRTARLWRRQGIDAARLEILRPLPWPAYRAGVQEADIALVPLLEGKTNDSRSDTKRVDVARMNAAAIYSRCPTFARCAVDGEIFVENTAATWLAAIDELVDDRERRIIARDATAASLEVMRQLASPGFPGLRFLPS